MIVRESASSGPPPQANAPEALASEMAGLHAEVPTRIGLAHSTSEESSQIPVCTRSRCDDGRVQRFHITDISGIVTLLSGKYRPDDNYAGCCPRISIAILGEMQILMKWHEETTMMANRVMPMCVATHDGHVIIQNCNKFPPWKSSSLKAD